MAVELFQIGVKALVTNAKGEVLVLKKDADSSSQKRWKEYWDIPGGRIESGGNVGNTITRELEEELGIDGILPGKFLAAGVSNHKISVGEKKIPLFLVIYECSLPEGAEIILNEEHSEFLWVSKKKAQKMLADKFPNSILDQLC